ncbi:hypothetical protein BGY98DRAFT_61127 [Russula aff. rugulosa BPL654]|nr:hypothetical protein BGY98DRAFT_61127 [Russula aff. rugulosa BPL654]
MKNTHDLHQKALQPVTLPSGLVMSNGLVKVAMYEHMATLFGGFPNARHLALYNLWSQGGWGMILTGNVQVSRDQLTLGKDMVVPETITSDTVHSYKTLARAMRPVSERNLSKNRDDRSMPHTLIIMQVSHTGRQSPSLLGGRFLFIPPLAPSACGLGRNASNWFGRLMYRILFPTPRTMSVQDIDNVVKRFVLGANLAHDAGFDGIELHASHGYLLAQFISPKTNIRDDAYGASHAPLYLLQRIVTSIRAVLPRPFVLGVKLSSSDYVGAGSVHDPRAEEEAEDRAVAHVVEVARWDMIDFIEVSGGDYENPVFLPSSRQAFFARFARKARSAIHGLTSPSQRPLVLLTGGMRSPAIFQDALTQGHADLVGIGRGSVLAPDLPLLLKEFYARQQMGTPDGDGDENNMGRDFLFKLPTLSYTETPLIRAAASVLRSLGILPLPSLIGAGTAMAWYIVTMRSISKGQKVNYQMGGLRAVVQLWSPELQILAILFSSCLACYILYVVSFF